MGEKVCVAEGTLIYVVSIFIFVLNLDQQFSAGEWVGGGLGKAFAPFAL